MKYLVFFVMVILASSVMAQVNTSNDTALTKAASSNIDVAFIFYKLAKMNPDFLRWAGTLKETQNIEPEKRNAFIASESENLKAAYSRFQADNKLITIRTRITLRPRVTAPHGGLGIEWPQADPIYFPYTAGGNNFALIPHNLEAFRFVPMKMEEASRIAGKIDDNGQATLVLDVRPKTVDARGPLKLDGIDQWLMMGDVGFIGIYNQYLESLWSYKAPWYDAVSTLNNSKLSGIGK